ncbi:MAG TPA: MogA/MoaB family molybdenum cofactor biosynthesis protein [Syntrophobacteraceae bacterium]|nr:MogA/MoaB family molybdenum cofactor biosynthesis protein [Syntrophobacteraceae bacterium]
MSEKRFRRTVAIITVSDKGSRGEREDASGNALEQYFESRGFQVVHREIVPDEVREIARSIVQSVDEKKAALVVTTGGTGVAPRDVTPEATLQVLDRSVPGMAEAMRATSLAKTPHAMISRAVVGIRKEALIVNLPGSPKGALENLDAVMPAVPHALEKIQGDPSECAAS